MAWWDTYPQRAKNELRALKAKLPAFPVYTHWKPAAYCAACRRYGQEGSLHLVVYTRFLTAVGNSYVAMMVYPCDFPNQIPAVFSEERLSSCGHYFPSRHELCLTDETSNSAITGVNVLAWAKDWFQCYDIWELTGTFPSTNHGRHRIR
jgi:hypothetical protein